MNDPSTDYLPITRDLISFIRRSPTSYHAVSNLCVLLSGHGFLPLKEHARWDLQPGCDYYVVRGGSSLIAFRVPEQDFENFQITAAHSDSPTFRLKTHPEIIREQHYVQLNVEKYGSMLCAPWFDRPLSVAGRVLVRDGDGLRSELVNLDQDLCLIPNLAIHMNRSANEGLTYQIQQDLLPVIAQADGAGRLRSLIAAELEADEVDLLDADLYLYNRTPGTIWGADEAFFSSPRIDDLQCAWTAVKALIDGANDTSICVAAIFDNEEVGSRSMQGADSTFLSDTLQRVAFCLGKSPEQYRMAVSSGFLLSADNAHAVHPAHPEVADPTNRPYLNQGPVLKYHAGQKYTTSGASAAVFRLLCERENIPLQTFCNHSDRPGGSTLGNLSNAHVSICSADIGLAQLAMHSPYETGGVRDTAYLLRALTAFYRTHISCRAEQFLLR